jgi:hypothetical protein
MTAGSTPGLAAHANGGKTVIGPDPSDHPGDGGSDGQAGWGVLARTN